MNALVFPKTRPFASRDALADTFAGRKSPAVWAVLVNMRAYPETTQRADAISGMVEKFGGHVVSLFWTVGAYDLVAVVEAPDAETITASLLRLGALGNVRTTMRAFRQDEMTGIVAKAGAS
jgi:uncharacterized protein with GYD domain